LGRVAAEIWLGMVYLVVSGVWGVVLGVVAAVPGTAVSLDLAACDPQGRAALAILLAVAVVFCCAAACDRQGMGRAVER
jgi:hypothetical protein